jgi:hypothetical protein
MKHAYKIIAEENLVQNTIVGVFTYEEFRNLMDNIMNDERFKPSMHMFWDFRQADVSDFSTDQINRASIYMERKQKKRGDGYRVAILVNKTVDYGLGRMYQAFSDSLPFDLQIFYDEQQAMDWIEDNPS